jgi:hypothetical protein
MDASVRMNASGLNREFHGWPFSRSGPGLIDHHVNPSRMGWVHGFMSDFADTAPSTESVRRRTLIRDRSCDGSTPGAFHIIWKMIACLYSSQDYGLRLVRKSGIGARSVRWVAPRRVSTMMAGFIRVRPRSRSGPRQENSR